MLYAITGKPGSGKSYFLAHKYCELVDKNPNVVIFSNTPMTYKGHKTIDFYDLNDLLTIFFAPQLKDLHRIVFLDEAYYLLDSKNWKSFSAEMTVALRQHRKLLVDMYVIAQDWNNLHIDFRRLVNNVIYSRKSLSWLVFIANLILPLFYRKNFSPWFFSRYEEYNEVSESQNIPFIKNEGMNAQFREGKMVLQNPNSVAPNDGFSLGQKDYVRKVYDTMLQIAKPSHDRLNEIFHNSVLFNTRISKL